MPPILTCGRFDLTLDRPLVMGVVNVTPDSFSDGGRYLNTDRAITHALELVDQGADILDIGGESTRPGAPCVSVEDELARVLPVLKGLRDCPVPLSVDTRKPAVMQAALDLGADMINDVSGFEAPGALTAVAGHRVALCIMHKQGEPDTMQQQPSYQDVVGQVSGYLVQRRDAALAAGIAAGRIVLDPGFGFGKHLEHNLALFRHLTGLCQLGSPLLVGVSRKSMIGQILGGYPVEQRDAGSVAAALMAAQAGAAIVRVHAVRATCDALKIWQALRVSD